MYNNEIYNKLEEKFGAFNMPIICKGIAEMYSLLHDEQIKVKPNNTNEYRFEYNWWTSAVDKANKSINEND